jgi:hypothetical protein
LAVFHSTSRRGPRIIGNIQAGNKSQKGQIGEAHAMQTAKQEVEELLKQLPDDSTHEDIQYHLYVLEKIRKGQDDINQGRTSGHIEAKEQLKKWLGH